MATFRIFFGLLAFPVAALMLSAEARERLDAGQETISIKVTEYPVFPLSMQKAGFSEGTVRYLISLDETGELEDALAVEATHVDFAYAVDRLIERWEFEPHRVNGEAVPVIFPLEIHFRGGSGVVSLVSGVDLPTRLARLMHAPGYYRAYELRELDRTPRPIRRVQPRFPSSLSGQSFEKLEIKFSIYIDHHGNVRMPVVKSTNQEVEPAILYYIQETLKEWKFEPPLVRDRLVLARVVQPVHFDGVIPGIESFELDERYLLEPE